MQAPALPRLEQRSQCEHHGTQVTQTSHGAVVELCLEASSTLILLDSLALLNLGVAQINYL